MAPPWSFAGAGTYGSLALLGLDPEASPGPGELNLAGPAECCALSLRVPPN